MPGIAGLIIFKQTPDKADVKRDVDRMSDILCHTSPCFSEKICFESGAIAAVRPDAYSCHGLVSENETASVAFWGYLWNDDELQIKSGLHFGSLREIPIGELLLAIYRKQGMEGFYSLNGRFAISLWQKKEKKLHLMTDRYGFAHLYYSVNAAKIFFASEYKAFIWHQDVSRNVDEEGLADFMTLGYCAADRTLLQDVKLVSPGSVITFEADKAAAPRRYWDYSFHSEDDPLGTEEDYIEQFYEKLRTAVKRQTDSAKTMAIPLSGGLDSRTLAGMVEALGFPGRIETFSYGNPLALDVVYGKKIANILGFNHSYMPIESTYLRDHAEQFVWLMDGSVNCLNAHMLLTHPYIRSHDIGTVVSGFFGDIICGSVAWIDPMAIRGRTDDEEIFRHHYALHANIMNDAEMENYARKDFYERTKGSTFGTLRTRYFACPSKSRYYRLRYFGTHERQRRYTSFNLYVFDPVAEVVAPFLDNDFVEFAYHMPPTLSIYQNIYLKMIVKHLPKVASVPYNKTRLPLNASKTREGLQWRWEKLAKNAVVRATIGKKYTKLNDNYLNSGNAIRSGSRDFVVSHIKNNPFIAEYFSLNHVHQMLDNHLAGKRNEYGKITALLTLSLWHNLFIEPRGYDNPRD
jgi:asparagine synthase (glutamine-hydrolysing)